MGRCSKILGFKKDSVRVNAAVRKRARKVRICTAHVEEELMLVERAIPVSDVIAGFCRFHGDYCDDSVDAISRTSAGLEGWANYEKQQWTKKLPFARDASSQIDDERAS